MEDSVLADFPVNEWVCFRQRQNMKIIGRRRPSPIQKELCCVGLDNNAASHALSPLWRLYLVSCPMRHTSFPPRFDDVPQEVHLANIDPRHDRNVF